MRKKTIKVTTLIASSIVAMNCYAVETGAYIGAQVGQTNTHNVARNVQTGTTPATVLTTPSNTGFGGRVFGGYQFNQYAALEGGFTYYSPSDYKPSISTRCGNPQIRESALDIVGKGIFPFGSFGVFGKAGIAIVRQSASGSITSTTISNCGSDDGTTTAAKPTAGVGVSYDITQNVVADLSFTRVFGGGKIQNADLVALGVSYHFVDKYCGQFLC